MWHCCHSQADRYEVTDGQRWTCLHSSNKVSSCCFVSDEHTILVTVFSTKLAEPERTDFTWVRNCMCPMTNTLSISYNLWDNHICLPCFTVISLTASSITSCCLRTSEGPRRTDPPPHHTQDRTGQRLLSRSRLMTQPNKRNKQEAVSCDLCI